MIPTNDLVRIAGVGGGLDLRNANLPTEDLVRIAGVASGKGAQVLIKGNKPTEDLVRIAAVGKGCVVIYFD